MGSSVLWPPPVECSLVQLRFRRSLGSSTHGVSAPRGIIIKNSAATSHSAQLESMLSYHTSKTSHQRRAFSADSIASCLFQSLSYCRRYILYKSGKGCGTRTIHPAPQCPQTKTHLYCPYAQQNVLPSPVRLLHASFVRFSNLRLFVHRVCYVYERCGHVYPMVRTFTIFAAPKLMLCT